MKLYSNAKKNEWGQEEEDDHPGYSAFGKQDDDKAAADYHNKSSAGYMGNKQDEKDPNVYSANKGMDDKEKEKKESEFDRMVEAADKKPGQEQEQQEEAPLFNKKAADIIMGVADDMFKDSGSENKDEGQTIKSKNKESIEKEIEKQKWVLQ